jgi:1-acyl-sn-glycerol-3-phosphate acyltransferase
MNHPSWWDAMTPIALFDQFPRGFEQFAAIDARAVEQYGFFKRLGFFGIDPSSVRGAATFLRIGEAILSQPKRAVWVTAQGQFTDARVRPLNLRSGVGHLAARMARGFVVPIAIEYPFWNERTPEALFRIGTPLDVTEFSELSGKEWTARIESALTDAMDGLAADAMTRDPARFTTIIGGTVGVGGMYDRWRRLKSWVSGKKFDPSHGGAEA